MKNYKNKQFVHFKSHAVPSSMIKSHAFLLQLAQDVNHPFVQLIYAVYEPCPVSHFVPI